MKIRLILPLMLILFSQCKKEDKIDPDIIPGGFTGAVYYFTYINGGSMGVNLADSSINSGYKAVIKKNGTNYIISFDKVHSITIPDISLEVFSSSYDNIVGIKTTGGQVYTSFVNGSG